MHMCLCKTLLYNETKNRRTFTPSDPRLSGLVSWCGSKVPSGSMGVGGVHFNRIQYILYYCIQHPQISVKRETYLRLYSQAYFRSFVKIILVRHPAGLKIGAPRRLRHAIKMAPTYCQHAPLGSWRGSIRRRSWLSLTTPEQSREIR